MTTPLYIPKTLVVGFQKRSDTFTGKLAYVIYKDHTGKLRKEKSWNGWRDHTIEMVEVDNVPTPNFTLNKGVQRSREWFGTGRSMVRVWDPRDFEFEITVDNLLNVLMHADVSKRDITESCVYAWQGTNLVLLPTNSVEYQESVAHTPKQGVKVSAKELVVGHTYSSKRDTSTRAVYLGRLDRFDIERAHSTNVTVFKQKPKKHHVFIDEVSHEILVKEPSAFVANVLSDEANPNLAALYDKYYASVYTQPVSGLGVDMASAIPLYTHRLWYEINGEYVQIELAQRWMREANNHGGSYVTVVEPSAYVVYDSELCAVRGAHNDRETGSWYSRSYRELRVTYPGTLNPQHPGVQEIVTRARAATAAFDAEHPSDNGSHDYNTLHRRVQYVATITGGGTLNFGRADGTFPTDFSF